MKYAKFFIPVVAALAAISCSTKDSKETAAQEKKAEQVEQAAPASANDGKVVVLDDPSKLAPGVKVNKLTVVDFNAVWCGPCRQLTPVLDEMAKKYAGKADFYSVDIDNFPTLMDAYNLGNSIPVVLFLKPDGSREHYVGIGDLLPAEKFEALIEKNL